MEKSQVISELHILAYARLFGSGPWLADREVCVAIKKKLRGLGVEESVSEDTTQATPLGKEVDLSLMSVFFGIHCEWEIPYILETHGLIDAIEGDRLLNRLPATQDDERSERLLPIVQRAFLKYFNPSGRFH